jgi:hypothetical protein
MRDTVAQIGLSVFTLVARFYKLALVFVVLRILK